MITRYVTISILTSLFTATAVQAQTSPPPQTTDPANKQAEADQLYRSAWLAANERNHDKACPLFDAAVVLVPDYQKAAIAAAQCYEEAGKYLTAVNRYLRAQEVAALQKVQDVKMLALITTGINSATNRISYVTIYVPGSVGSIEGVSVTLNGKVVDPTTYGTKIPLDRGKYQIVTSAPKRISSQIDFEVNGNAQDFKRTLVPLEMEPEDPKPDEPKAPTSPSSNEPASNPTTKNKKEESKLPRKVVAPSKPATIDASGSSFANQKNEERPLFREPPKSKENSTPAGGVALILLGGGLITGASFLAKEAVDLNEKQMDYSTYAGSSIGVFITGATACLVGVALLSSTPTPTEKRAAFVLHSPKLLIGPGQVTFQARW